MASEAQLETLNVDQVRALSQERVIGCRKWPAHLTVDQMRAQLENEAERPWLHDREHEAAALAVLAERKRRRA